MPASRLDPVVKHLRRAVLRRQKGLLTDGQLLEEFIATRDAASFEMLVRRHGPMVLGVCRRVLGNVHDAEDAFQASFLVLARKAASVSPREAVGNWLYGVANTTAHRAKVANAKRRIRERQVLAMPEPASAPRNAKEDLLALLDQELARLADKYRLPIVLCDLEGRTRKEVARQLKVPEGTISSRLATGRRLLAKRLARHGVETTGIILGAVLSHTTASASVPLGLIAGTVKAASLVATGQAVASCVTSAQIAVLMEGVLKMMLVRKLKLIMAAILAIVITCYGLSGVTRQAAGQSEPQESTPAREGKPSLSSATTRGLEALQGVWKVVAIKSGAEGKMLAVESGGEVSTTLKAFFLVDSNRACWQTEGGDIEGGLYLDPMSSPKAYDLATSKKTYEGIYELKGDTLRLCFDHADEAPRPTKFSVLLGSRQVLIVLKRQTRGRINWRRPDGSRGFPDLLQRPTPYQPPPAVLKQPAPEVNAKAKSKARIGQIIITGNTRIPSEYILYKLLPFHPGEVLDYASLRKAEQNLADSKHFVVDPQRGIRPTITVLDSESGIRDVLVAVTELEPEQKAVQRLRRDSESMQALLQTLEKRLPDIKDDATRKAIKERAQELQETLRRLEKMLSDLESMSNKSVPRDWEEAGVRGQVNETHTGSLRFGIGVNSDAGLVGSIVLNERNFELFRPPTSLEDILGPGRCGTRAE